MSQLVSKFNNGIDLMYDNDIRKYYITDGWLSDYIIFYDTGEQLWACDGIFGYNAKSIGGDIFLYLNTIGQHIRNNKEV